MPEPPVPTRGTGTGQEVPGGLSGLSPHPLLDLSLLFTLLLPRLPGLWVIGKINLSAQLAGSNQSLGLGCNLIPWGGGRRVELSRGSQGEGLCTPLPCLPQYVGAKMVLLLACSPLSTLKAPPHSSLGSSLSVTPPGRASTLADFVDLVLVSPAPVMGPWRGAVTSSPRTFSESVLNTGQRHACHGQEMSLTAQLYEAPIVHHACSVQQHFSLHWA